MSRSHKWQVLERLGSSSGPGLLLLRLLGASCGREAGSNVVCAFSPEPMRARLYNK